MRLWNRKSFTALLLVFVLFAGMLSAETGGVRAEVIPERISESEWKKLPTGSAGVLEGRSVLISIFVNDKVSKWTKKAIWCTHFNISQNELCLTRTNVKR